MQMINKQATIAKSNAAEIGALKRRQDAFAQLERAMPTVLFGRVVSSTSATALEELQRAIGAAREANVSEEVAQQPNPALKPLAARATQPLTVASLPQLDLSSPSHPLQFWCSRAGNR